MKGYCLATVFAAAIAGKAAAQFTEETVQVPLSRETRAEAEPAHPDADAWREAAAPYDIERIDGNDTAFTEALATARSVGSAEDQTALLGLLADLPVPVDPDALPGEWDCRTIRIGGEPAQLNLYGWWRCQISNLSAGLLVEKLTGSELTSGYLYPESDTRMIYLGHWHGRNEPAAAYDGADGPEGDDPENRDDAGILTQRGPDRLLLVRPRPTFDGSDYDILEFRR